MQIAIPLVAGHLSEHFGHCEQFAFIEADPASKQILSQKLATPPPHAPGVLPRWLHQQGTNVVIVSSMGQGAQRLCAEHGIAVRSGVPGETPENLARAFLDGALDDALQECDHQGCH